MKLVCINDNWTPAPTPETPCPKFWEECESVEVKSKHGLPWYVLAGYPANRGFRTDYFAVLPERSADEMGEEREAIVNIETQPA